MIIQNILTFSHLTFPIALKEFGENIFELELENSWLKSYTTDVGFMVLHKQDNLPYVEIVSQSFADQPDTEDYDKQTIAILALD